jgi:hypothetical protein
VTEAAPDRRSKHAAPWRGRGKVDEPRACFINVRCTAKESAAINEAASRAGYKVGPYLRALALGTPGPRSVRRPPIERTELARLLGHIGKLGSNVNQIAKAVNTTRNLPSWSELAVMSEDVGKMRAAVLKALNRGPKHGD